MKWLDKILKSIAEAQYNNSRQGTRIIPTPAPVKPPKGSTRDFDCSPPEGSRPPEPKNQYGNKIPEPCYEAPENPKTKLGLSITVNISETNVFKNLLSILSDAITDDRIPDEVKDEIKNKIGSVLKEGDISG